MGNKHTADGRWIVGNGNSGDDYKGFLHWRECYICLTEDGATEDSVNYLNALKDYALAHYALGEPIMPPSMTVWVVANGKATAVQADDVKVEDGDYTICGINYSDGAWDYSNAGQGQGGGGDMFFVTFSWDDDADGGNGGYVCDKTHAEIKAAYNDGKVLLSKEDGGEWGTQYGFGTVTPVNFQAYYMYADTGSISVRKYNVSSSNVVTVTDFVATATQA